MDWSRPIVAGALTGYIAALFGYYTLEPLILRLGGATTLNLSLLAANCWDAAARVFLLGGFSARAGRDFVVSLAFVTLGGAPTLRLPPCCYEWCEGRCTCAIPHSSVSSRTRTAPWIVRNHLYR